MGELRTNYFWSSDHFLAGDTLPNGRETLGEEAGMGAPVGGLSRSHKVSECRQSVRVW